MCIALEVNSCRVNTTQSRTSALIYLILICVRRIEKGPAAQRTLGEVNIASASIRNTSWRTNTDFEVRSLARDVGQSLIEKQPLDSSIFTCSAGGPCNVMTRLQLHSRHPVENTLNEEESQENVRPGGINGSHVPHKLV